MAWIRRFSGWRRLMAADGVLGWRDELDVLKQRLGPLFVRPEPRRQAGLYLEALLSGAQRKNGWQLPSDHPVHPLQGVAGLARNRWLVCVGITGWLQSESAAALRRNAQQRARADRPCALPAQGVVCGRR